MFLKLEKVEGVPGDEEVLRITKEISTESETDEGEKWINHQLYQVLCMNLEGNALKMVKNLNMKSNKWSAGMVQTCV